MFRSCNFSVFITFSSITVVAITAGCATVDTWAAVVIGMISGWVYLAISKLLVKLRIDDAVDAVPVHMGGGAWGLLSTGLFTKPSLLLAAYGTDAHPGWFYAGDDFARCGCQLIGILFIFGWASVVMGTFFYVLNMLGWYRIDPLEEEVGMDISRHKGSCYDMSSPDDEQVKQLEASRQEDLSLSLSRRGMKSPAVEGAEAQVEPVERKKPADSEVDV